jgi:hypothetical protein
VASAHARHFQQRLALSAGHGFYKLLVTGAHFDGFWEINNCYSTAFHLGGSDNRLWSNGGFLDSGTAFNSTAGQAHMWLDDIGTRRSARSTSRAKVRGPALRLTAARLTVAQSASTEWRLKAATQGAPSNGAVVRMNGGVARFRDCDFHYGMANPSAQGRTPADAGIIHHAGGQLVVAGAQYDKATSVAFTVPLVYTAATDGKCIVQEVQTGPNGGTWTHCQLLP